MRRSSRIASRVHRLGGKPVLKPGGMSVYRQLMLKKKRKTHHRMKWTRLLVLEMMEGPVAK